MVHTLTCLTSPWGTAWVPYRPVWPWWSRGHWIKVCSANSLISWVITLLTPSVLNNRVAIFGAYIGHQYSVSYFFMPFLKRFLDVGFHSAAFLYLDVRGKWLPFWCAWLHTVFSFTQQKQRRPSRSPSLWTRPLATGKHPLWKDQPHPHAMI